MCLSGRRGSCPNPSRCCWCWLVLLLLVLLVLLLVLLVLLVIIMMIKSSFFTTIHHQYRVHDRDHDDRRCWWCVALRAARAGNRWKVR
jgi:hypothetical protein